MARYYDLDSLRVSDINVGTVMFPRMERCILLKDIESAPTADVVPKSEVEYWKEQCFHACMNNGCLDQRIITRLFENAEGHNDPRGEDSVDGLELAITQAKAEVAREIFEDIESMAKNGMVHTFSSDFAELKKKYTEGASI